MRSARKMLAAPVIGAGPARQVAAALWRIETLDAVSRIPMPAPAGTLPAAG